VERKTRCLVINKVHDDIDVFAMVFTTNSVLLDAPWFQALVSIYFHMKINQRSGVSLSPLARISFLIYVSVVFVLGNGKSMFPTPQIPESEMKAKYASISLFLVTRRLIVPVLINIVEKYIIC